jgi:hypothetical protein
MRRLVALAALLFALVFASASPAQEAKPCVLCLGAKSVACPTCGGDGRAATTCRVCRGAGKAPCLARPDGVDSPLRRMLTVASVHVGPQELDCGNWTCNDGYLGPKVLGGSLERGPCGACGMKGDVPCPDCGAAKVPCAECSARGATEAGCLDCAGTGTLHCLLCVPADAKCARCGGGSRVQCARCGGKGSAVLACRNCSARGRVVCRHCSGSGKSTCAGCVGLGWKMETRGSRVEQLRCAKCDGSGAMKCPKGGDGALVCPKCTGGKRTTQPCTGCGAKGQAACRSCGELGWRAAEALAGLLAMKPFVEAKEAAAMLYQRARQTAAAGAARVAAVVRKPDVAGLPAADAKFTGGYVDPRSDSAKLRSSIEEIRRRLEAELDRAAEDAEFAAAVARIDLALAKLTAAPK